MILDIDGTVLGSSGVVEPCIWEAVEAAHAAGVKLAVCTGRPGFGETLKLAERLGADNPHVFQSGAHVGYTDGRTVKVMALEERSTREIIVASRQLGAVLELYTPSTLFVERTTDLSKAHAELIGVNAIVRDLEDVAAHEPVVRAQWVVPTGQEAALLESLSSGVQLSPATSPVLKGVTFISITREGVSKGSAVTALLSQLRLDAARVMAVGDSEGDRSMLEVVGHPRVMSNATAELLTDFTVLGHVDDCGVVGALVEATGGKGGLLDFTP